MTNRTRRRLLVCLVATILLAPMEYLTISTLLNQHRPLPAAWLDRMDGAGRVDAARHIRDYPVVYRHVLLQSLAPDDQAEVWRTNAAYFVSQQPELGTEQRTLIQRLIAVNTASLFRRMPDAVAEFDSVELAARSLFSDEAYRYLLLDAGPPDAREPYQVAAFPLSVRIESFVRSRFVAHADDPGYNCECKMGTIDRKCTAQQTCMFDSNCTVQFKGCGPQGLDLECDGMCKNRDPERSGR